MSARFARVLVALAWCAGVSAACAAAGASAPAASPVALMEDFLRLREKALAQLSADSTQAATMSARLHSLGATGSATATAIDVHVSLFLHKGWAFLARRGGPLAEEARRRAQALLAAVRPVPRNCTYLDSGGIKVIFRGDPARREIALTYDDGPIEGGGSLSGTRAILKALEETGARATFFMVGQNARAFPHLVHAIRKAGHSIANHTRSHARGQGLPSLSVAGARDEVGSGKRMITEAMGGGPMPLFRLPYGAGVHMDRVNRVVGEFHPFSVFWTIDTNDWRHPGHSHLVRSVMDSSLKNGAIVLFHDHAPHTPDATRIIVKTLKPIGYRFITVDEMLGIDRQTAFLDGFEEASRLAAAGQDQAAYDRFVRLAQEAPTTPLAQEALDFAYLLGRLSLGPRQVQAARLLLAHTLAARAGAPKPAAAVPPPPAVRPGAGASPTSVQPRGFVPKIASYAQAVVAVPARPLR
jgi:peptidoglycan/xylan/chitin deacetylase (PgdA/CDA1 family)